MIKYTIAALSLMLSCASALAQNTDTVQRIHYTGNTRFAHVKPLSTNLIQKPRKYSYLTNRDTLDLYLPTMKRVGNLK